MQAYRFDHVAPAPCTAYAVVVRSLRNAEAILQDVKTGGKRFGDLPMALVDVRMLTSAQHILVAVHQAMLRNARNAADPASVLKTKTIHSEILWNLSTTNNIAESFRTFGLSLSTQDLLLIHVARAPQDGGPTGDQVLERIQSIVEGEIDERGLRSLDDWKDAENPSTHEPDWTSITKAYKLHDIRSDDSTISEKDRQRDLREKIDAMTTSLVAMKFVAS